MATATKTANSVEDAAAKVSELTDETSKKLAGYVEQALAGQKKLALAAIDSYEDSVLRLVDAYETAVADSNIDWLKDAVTPQTAATRELTAAYVSAARQLVN